MRCRNTRVFSRKREWEIFSKKQLSNLLVFNVSWQCMCLGTDFFNCTSKHLYIYLYIYVILVVGVVLIEKKALTTTVEHSLRYLHAGLQRFSVESFLNTQF